MRLWRAIPAWAGLALGVCLWGTLLFGQAPGGGDHFAVPNIPRGEAMEILERFRRMGLANDYSVTFILRHLPRRGEELSRAGRLWGTFTPDGPLTLFEIYPVDPLGKSVFLLVKNGETPQVWRSDSPDKELQPVAEEDWFDPLVEGFLYSAFDAAMPFIFWPNAEYTESKRVLGRRAHIYRSQAPESFAKHFPSIRAVDMALDAQFDALIQANLIGPESNRPVRSFNVLSFKKVGEEYIVGVTEMRDNQTRDRTLLEVTSAVLNIRLPEEMFQGNQLPVYPDIPFDHYTPVR